MYRNSIISRSSKISSYSSKVIDEAILPKPKMVKEAKAIPVFNRKKLSESQKFLEGCKSYGLGMYQASNGSVWSVEQDENGEKWLIRNADLTEENKLIDNIIKECKKA